MTLGRGWRTCITITTAITTTPTDVASFTFSVIISDWGSGSSFHNDMDDTIQQLNYWYDLAVFSSSQGTQDISLTHQTAHIRCAAAGPCHVEFLDEQIHYHIAFPTHLALRVGGAVLSTFH